jgi:predicted NBD/HSP70 family sugar kinase
MLWGIDLGGTKMEVVVLRDASSLEEILRKRISTEAEGGFEHIVQRIRTLVEMAVADMGERPEHIGMGTPGTIDPATGLMKNSNTVCLNGARFHERIQEVLGIPITIANDANCFALAEARFGAATKFPNVQVVFGVILGTGVGGGVVVDGKLIHGKHGIGGEWGHIFLDASGGQCYCGQIGCVEQVISGPALQRYYHELTGIKRPLPEIVQRHRDGIDPKATQTIFRLTSQFARGIATVINIIDPDVIVLGGGVGNIDDLYSEGVQAVSKWIFNDKCETHFVRPELGDSAGVIGAALLNE